MEVIIRGSAEEIAALVLAVQEQREGNTGITYHLAEQYQEKLRSQSQSILVHFLPLFEQEDCEQQQ